MKNEMTMRKTDFNPGLISKIEEYGSKKNEESKIDKN